MMKMQSISDKKIKIGFIILTVLFFVYVAVRAFTVNFCHDEIVSYNQYIKVGHFGYYHEAGDANNHLLNTFLSKVSFKLFGFSQFSLRLPNVISFLIFCFFLFKIGQFIKDKLIRIALYIVLITSVYFIQFFSVSRGYGLSIAFLFASFYYMLSYLEKKKIAFVYLHIISISLAMLANLSLILVGGISFGLLLYSFLFQHKSKKTMDYFPFIVYLIPLGLAAWFSFMLKDSGALYYGSLDGFWKVTIDSLLRLLFENNTANVYIYLIVFLMLLFGLGVVFQYQQQKKILHITTSNLFVLILLFNVLGILVLANFMEVNYPKERVGIHLYPILILSFIFLLEGIKWRKKAILLGMLIPITMHGIANLNLDKVSLWDDADIPLHYYEIITKNILADTDQTYPIVAGHPYRYPEYNFKVYQHHGRGNLFQKWDTDNLTSINNSVAKYADYLIASEEEIDPIKSQYIKIDTNKWNNLCLWKNTLQIQPILISNDFKRVDENNEEFFGLYENSFDSAAPFQLLVEVNAKLLSKEKFFRGIIMVDVRDSKGDMVQYQDYELHFLKDSWTEEDQLHQKFIVNVPKAEPVTVKLYLWNKYRQFFEIKKGLVNTYGLYILNK